MSQTPNPKQEEIEEVAIEELAVAETGQPIEAEIIEIFTDKCKDFPIIQKIRNEAIKQRWLERGDAKCIQLVVRVDGQEYALFPIRISNNPRSNYYRLLKTYGKKEGSVYRLGKGAKIKVVFTERGFPRVYIPT